MLENCNCIGKNQISRWFWLLSFILKIREINVINKNQTRLNFNVSINNRKLKGFESQTSDIISRVLQSKSLKYQNKEGDNKLIQYLFSNSSNEIKSTYFLDRF